MFMGKFDEFRSNRWCLCASERSIRWQRRSEPPPEYQTGECRPPRARAGGGSITPSCATHGVICAPLCRMSHAVNCSQLWHMGTPTIVNPVRLLMSQTKDGCVTMTIRCNNNNTRSLHHTISHARWQLLFICRLRDCFHWNDSAT